jgi:hypothetical protein
MFSPQITGRRLYVICGQSNATGGANPATLSDQSYINPYNNVWLAEKVGTSAGYPDWTTRESVLKPRGLLQNNMGMELSLGRRLDEFFGANNVAICKFALTGSGLADNWVPSANWPLSNNLIANQLITYIQAQEVALGATLAGICWSQGNGDTAVQAKADAYGANLRALVKHLRENLKKPFVFFYERLPTAVVGTYVSNVQAQQDLVSGDGGMILIQSSALALVDADHYTADSFISLGILYADAIKKHSDTIVQKPAQSAVKEPSIGPHIITQRKTNAVAIPVDNAIKMPTTDLEWERLGIQAPFNYWLMQVGSGNVPSLGSAANALVPNGTVDYSQSGSPFTGVAIGITETAAERLELGTSAFDPSADSAAAYMVAKITGATGNRPSIALCSAVTNPQSMRIATAGQAQVVSNANITTGAYVYEGDGLWHPFLLVFNRTAGTIKLFSDRELITGTYDGTATNATSKGFGGGTPPAFLIRYGAWWYGDMAESLGATTLTALGWTQLY